VGNTIEAKGIADADIWNFDESGFAIGMIDTHMVICSSETRGRYKAVQPGDREWVTLIQGASGVGNSIPPYLVVKGKCHLASWYEDRVFGPDWAVNLSETGWTNNTIGLDWLKHFDKHTRDRIVGVWRLLVLDGHESHYSDEFEEYCKENRIITLFMPPHSSHLLQPLDVGVFSPLKKAYGKEIDRYIQMGITHITKAEFFPAFRRAFDATFTKENIQGGFRGAGLVPLNAQRVIEALDIRLPASNTDRPVSSSSEEWLPQTPKTTKDLGKQLNFVIDRAVNHAGSSPSKLLNSAGQLEKGAHLIIHTTTLVSARVEKLEEGIATLSKRRGGVNTRLQTGGSMSQQQAEDKIDDLQVSQQIKQETDAIPGSRVRNEQARRHCGLCGKVGHNRATCDKDRETTIELDSD
jgi:hypothetical protein